MYEIRKYLDIFPELTISSFFDFMSVYVYACHTAQNALAKNLDEYK